MKKSLYILCGPPASGKSTFAKKMLKNAVYISRDAIRFDLLDKKQEQDNYFACEDEVFAKFIDKIVWGLLLQDSLIVDATHISPQSRKKLLSNIDEKYSGTFNITYFSFEVPLDICLARNAMREGRERVPEDVLKKMHKKFSRPRYKEDDRIETIIVVNEKYQMEVV